MENLTTHTCEECLFLGDGFVIDRSARLAKGFGRKFKPGHICLLRPPIADKVDAATEADRRCALFTDKATGAQPMRHLLPEIMQPVLLDGKGGAADGR